MIRLVGRLACTAAVALLLGATGEARAHPIHTTMTELGLDAKRRELTITVRVFADDFALAVRRSNPRVAGFDAQALAYVRGTFVLTEPGGRPLPLRSCGHRSRGGVVWLCFRAPAPRDPARLLVHNRMHFELYTDQVNLVQSTLGGRRRSTLFTPGDRPKRIG